MATAGNLRVSQAAQETVIKSVATGEIEVGASTPVVARLCADLLEAKGIIDGASRDKEELEELRVQCERFTLLVIDKARASRNLTIDVSPLQKCVDQLKVAPKYGGWAAWLLLPFTLPYLILQARRVRTQTHRVHTLRTSIAEAVHDMGEAMADDHEEKSQEIPVRLGLGVDPMLTYRLFSARRGLGNTIISGPP